MTKKIPVAKQFENIRSELIAVSFKQTDKNPENPINWYASAKAYETEHKRRSAQLAKEYGGKIEELISRLSKAEMMIELHKLVMPMQSKALEINARGLNSMVERSISAGIKRNQTKKASKDKYFGQLRKAIKELNNTKITRKEFFGMAKKLEIPRSPEAIQEYWSEIRKEFL